MVSHYWEDNYATVGRNRRIRIISTTETKSGVVDEADRDSTLKTKERNIKDQASFGGSLLKNNMEVEAAMDLSRHLHMTGLMMELRSKFYSRAK